MVGLIISAVMLAGCGSTSTPTQTASVPVAAATTATTPTPKKLSKKELTEQHARERKEAAEQHAHEKKEATERVAQERREHAAAEAAENAKKLLEIQKQEPVEASDSELQAVEGHLLSLSHKCTQSIPELAAQIDSGVHILKEAGKSESQASLAAALDKAAPGKNVSPDCKGVLAALLVLIEKGE